MRNDNDSDPGLGLALPSLATVTTELQTAGQTGRFRSQAGPRAVPHQGGVHPVCPCSYIYTLLPSLPPKKGIGGFVINTPNTHAQVSKPPADTQWNAQLFMRTKGQYGHPDKQMLGLIRST